MVVFTTYLQKDIPGYFFPEKSADINKLSVYKLFYKLVENL